MDRASGHCEFLLGYWIQSVFLPQDVVNEVNGNVSTLAKWATHAVSVKVSDLHGETLSCCTSAHPHVIGQQLPQTLDLRLHLLVLALELRFLVDQPIVFLKRHAKRTFHKL